MNFHPTTRFELAAGLTDGEDVLALFERKVDRLPRTTPPPRPEYKSAGATSAIAVQPLRPVLPAWISDLAKGKNPATGDQRGVLRAVRRHADATVITLAGRIDDRGATELAAALAPSLAQSAAAGAAVVLDLAGVALIGSAGLGVLLKADRQMRQGAGQLIIAAPQSVVTEIFTISGFNRFFTVTATLDDALALCSPAALAHLRSACAAAT